ncbi:MAG: DUF6186 family protein [Actinomycetota bacterium]|nr:DUF6186 family protein [Actinomycetota bacterium]MDQ3575641.1 DUF6186 family protein [Actinomycetota bacterium]
MTGPPLSATVLVCGFAVLLAAVVALEMRARLGSGNQPTLADVVDAALGHRAGRAAVLLSWLWVGWHLFVR